MSAFTGLLWGVVKLRCNRRGGGPRSGYGARPHVSEAKRREGYPTGQTTLRSNSLSMRPTLPTTTKHATSRNGSPRASDAASRPEKLAALTAASAIFLPASEKSSFKSTR